jgi:hypothetical protein
LLKFREEVDEIAHLFRRDKANPPIARDAPPVAGAIQWARSLFLRIKVKAFESIPILFNSPKTFAYNRHPFCGFNRAPVFWKQTAVRLPGSTTSTFVFVHQWA